MKYGIVDRRAKILCIILGFIIFLSGAILIFEHYSENHVMVIVPKVNKTSKEEVPVNELTESEVKADTKEMIEIMESTHPIFLEGETEKYKEAKAEFLRDADKNMTTDNFRALICKYLSSIQDGHTRIWWKETECLDVNWRYINDKLTILDENNKATNKTVTKINGVDIQKIFNNIDELFPAENYAAKDLNYAMYSKGENLLKYSGVDCSKDVVLTVMNGTKEEKLQVKFTSWIGSNPSNYEISSRKIDNDTIYVKFGVCDKNKDLDKVAENLKEALKSGTKNVIIDVRDNPGGNSEACNELMDALNIKPGEFGCVIRYSPLAQKQHGYKRTNGFSVYKRNNDAVPNPNINLYIITNEGTFSSAQWLATWVKDGKLGTIVGRPSSNMPSSFGDVLPFKLKNSKLTGQISYKKWTRPDKTKDSERTLEPDVYVDYSEDPLNKIMELIESKKKIN